MKAVKTRTPDRVAVNFATIPSHQSDAMCRTLIGGMWSYGTGAGLFCINAQTMSTSRVAHLPLVSPAWVQRGEPYPHYIPRRWIHLSQYAKKRRTRKKWKNEIERTIALHNKRQPKGAKT